MGSFVQANKFDISPPIYDQAEFSNFERPMTVYHTIGSGSDSVEVSLFTADCNSSNVLNSTVGLVQLRLLNYDGGSNFAYNISIDDSFIYSSSLVEFTGPSSSVNSTGIISFCTRVSTHLLNVPGVIIGSSYASWDIGFDMSLNAFDSLPTITSIASNDLSLVISDDLSINACACNTEGDCIVAEYVNGATLGFCLTPSSSAVQITNFNLTLSTTDGFEYTPILQGSTAPVIASNVLTSSANIKANTKYIQTILISGLFTGSNNIEVNGSASVVYVTDTSVKALSKTSENREISATIKIIKDNCLLTKVLDLFQ